MTRKSKREVEAAVEDLEATDPEAGDFDPRLVTKRDGQWVYSLTGEPADVDEDRDIIIDFQEVDT